MLKENSPQLWALVGAFIESLIESGDCTEERISSICAIY
jgi:hypothetical protein